MKHTDDQGRLNEREQREEYEDIRHDLDRLDGQIEGLRQTRRRIDAGIRQLSARRRSWAV